MKVAGIKFGLIALVAIMFLSIFVFDTQYNNQAISGTTPIAIVFVSEDNQNQQNINHFDQQETRQADGLNFVKIAIIATAIMIALILMTLVVFMICRLLKPRL